MSFASFRQSIESAFNTAWAGETAIRWENVEFTVPATEYVEFRLEPDLTEQSAISANPNMRERGIVRVRIFTRQNIGTARSEELADLVATALQRKNLPDGVTMLATSRRPAEIVEFESGAGWFVVDVETEYHADYADT